MQNHRRSTSGVTKADELFADLQVREAERDISARILAHCVAHAATLPAKERWRYFQPQLEKWKADEAAYEAASAAFKAEAKISWGLK